MLQRRRIMIIISLLLYLILLIYGIILADIYTTDIFQDSNFEKTLFLIYNLYIIVSFVLMIINYFKSKKSIYKFYIISIISFIIIRLAAFGWNIYQIFTLYNIQYEDAKVLIGSTIIKPDGLLPHIMFLLIILQLFIASSYDN